MTLEDKTGQVNVILCPGLLEKFRKEALGAALLAVYGLKAGRRQGAAPDRANCAGRFEHPRESSAE
ncbi:hypothetical protein L0Z37_29850 [Burkholderia multivorans]|uniref:hypothetical protein n=1 Tax=Burkholderia multivorans TaxID=87883 RepID=UPI00201A11CA|nr:hypothetical protein [Burkholderia multivorans]MCA8143595.1 hypothetical protein [Burkholderia multivorans]MCO1368603.1 hypothetical protein [Burkholderia multivorans]MCO1380494.1 hypothetical protein [Burkholderia multivorans]MDN8032387.1 hypothetical protein [Burkholderia multivorans]UQP21402.1 hypothetical protein L0Y98_18215 [Burkholderia multivorans]